MRVLILKLALLLFFFPMTSTGQSSATMYSPWMVYEVQKSHSLWNFAVNLGIKEIDINNFIKLIKADNPRLKDVNKIYPGDVIVVRSETLGHFLPKNAQYRTYWASKISPSRNLAGIQSVQHKPRGSDLLSVKPQFTFTRIDSEQRGSGASATLLSSWNFGLKGEYAWNNRWGPGSLALDMNWTEFNDSIGKEIARNQVMTMAFYYQQGINLESQWSLIFDFGLHQTPYMFTDDTNQLFLKVGTQPVTGLAIQKTFAVIKMDLKAHFQYYFSGYAGDTIVDEGFGYSLGVFKELKIWGYYPVFSLEGKQQNLLSTVTSQRLSEITMGASFAF